MTAVDWQNLVQGVPSLLSGLLVNLEILLGLIALGFAVGILVALVQVYSPRPLAALAVGYEWFFRGVPEMVLLMLIYFGLRQFKVRITPFTAAVIALGLRSSAYQSQIFRGAIQAVGRRQMMAALSVGMTRLQAIRHVILPQALRLSIPPWSNEFSSVLKDTTLASAIGVIEVFKKARFIMGRNYALALPIFLVVALFFLFLTYAGNWALGALERRYRIPGFEAKGAGERF
ncbi:MAG: amino acid ABC transporter permease [Caldiserica bacterium]|nr:amino acid ABC transporter permease [Caldisericota bacterium]